jgi:predicted nucleic acid-binding protein
MPASALVDTGAILAVLDSRDHWHVPCKTVFSQLRMPLLTSEAVLTEVFHLTGANRTAMEAAWKFLRSGSIVVGTIEDSEMAQLRSLMLQYWDRPMDFADATLVHLANRESLSTILTVDQADFATYRLTGKRRFQVLPLGRSS